MRALATLVLCYLFAGLAGCQHSLTCDNGYNITAAAKSGCRSPSDPGCAMCCVQHSSNCEIRMDTIAASDGTTSYSTIQSKPSCPSGCAPCATCSVYDEKRLCQTLAIPDASCDCAKITIINDACAESKSCACYCLTYKGLLETCPNQ